MRKINWRGRSRAYAAAVCVVAFGAGVTGAAAEGSRPAVRPAALASEAPAGFVSLAPQRVLDTRSGIGTATGKTADVTLSFADNPSVPDDATAVVLNLTATNSTADSYLSAQPAGVPEAYVSNVNFYAGVDTANLATVQLGENQSIRITSAFGVTDMVADLAGYYVTLSDVGGVPGPAGPAGPTGPQGPMGTGLTVLGSLDDSSELPASGSQPGDAYLIDGELWVWDGEAWVNAGSVQGPAGPAGPAGADGAAGAQGPAGPVASPIFLSGAQSAAPTTVLGGVLNTRAVLPLSGFLAVAPTAATVGGVLDLSPATDVSQPMPTEVTVNTLDFDASTTLDLTLVGSTISLSATLYVDGLPTTLTCTATPALTGLVSAGSESTCATVGADVLVPAGADVAIVVSADVTAGIDVATVVTARVSTGVGYTEGIP